MGDVMMLVGALGQFEGETKLAVPVLRQYLGDTNGMISITRSANLRKIL